MAEPAASEGGFTPHAKDAASRITTVHILQVLAVAALVLPLALFSFASWVAYRGTQALANERIARSLDVMQEQALKVFQSMDVAVGSIQELLGSRTEAEIAADEQAIHDWLQRINASLPEVQSIWIFDSTGHPAAITREVPAPKSEYYGNLDYFVGARADAGGVYIGGIHQSVSGGKPYFTFSRARRAADGKFLGVIEMSLLPNDFAAFYAQLMNSGGLDFAMIRADGTMLVRYPPVAGQVRLDERSGFRHAVEADAAGGFFTTSSESDNVERQVGIRRLPGYPVYVSAGIATSELRSEWMGGMAMHLIFGIPATAFLFGAIIVVLQRTRRLYAEQDRREAAEAAMRQAQRLDAIGHLTGGVAHDFNNLLMIILGNLESAQRQVEAGLEGAKAKLERAIANAMQGAKRAATLTQRLLAFSRLQPLDPHPLDINRLLNDLTDFLARTLGEAISLEVIGAAGLWTVEADQGQLETALLNLAVNARDAMPDGGALTLETGNAYIDDAYCRAHGDVRPGQYVLISVTDSGTGMPRDAIERAFDPFYTTKAAGQGTGLGLSQVYGFVKQSGGHVKIYSELGEGTTVKIYLPRFFGEARLRNKAAAEVVSADIGRGERILVVEDDHDVRSYIVETLRGMNYAVSEAHDAEQALSLSKDHLFDLLLTDVILPGMNGRQLADRLQESQPAVRVLFMTGYSRNAIVHQGRLDSGVQLLQKPVTSIELAKKVREMLVEPAAVAGSSE